jgi:tetratricopeptide (TPR) repeat protein
MRIRQQLGWIILFFTLVPVSGAAQSTACDPWAAKIASVQGNVEAKRSDTADWRAVTLNEIYCPGDQIRVGDKSRAGIILANETLVRLDANSAIKLTSIEKETFSLVELFRGIAHFISRVPRSLKVNTPFVNAAIEGTEFVVAIANQQTTVTVFEGTVLTQNDQGELRISNGESAVAKTDTAPSKVLLARPRDAVQWALYFPPVVEASEGKLAEASRLLKAGRFGESEEILKTLDSAEAKALLSVIAVVNNDRDKAFALASESVQQAPQSAAAHIALSYAWQAKLDLQMALASATEATKQAPDNAIAWARLAELQLSVGELDDALDSAQQATQLNANLSRTQSILGYAYLVRIDIDEAKAAFEKAILLDQTDPLPRLGLGLAKIRRNALADGRRDIEVAAMLDPNNAIIRSYLGKAYFEEKRGPLDAEQFAMAKQLDPNDPTPYYYDAIRKQTENNPVGALKDINKSIELNDNRAVYRSSLQLDQDEAARNVSQARIYQDLGFELSAENEATRSLTIDPGNHSAHRFLSDAYNSQPRHGTARASELLQAQLLQPINTMPVQPQSTQANIPVLRDTGPGQSSGSDFNSLFIRNSHHLLVDTALGTNNTKGSNIILSGLHDIFSYSLGAYNYNTDGFRPNNDLHENIRNAFVQMQLAPNFSLQLERRTRKTENGDLNMQFDPSDFSSLNRRNSDKKSTRLGIRHSPTQDTTLLFSAIDAELDTSQSVLDIAPSNTDDISNKSDQYEFQFINSAQNYNLIFGLSDYKNDVTQKTIFDWTDVFGFACPPSPPFPPVPCEQNLDYIDEHRTIYFYTNLNTQSSHTWTFGASYDSLNQRDFNESELNPKLGVQWRATEDTRIRAAYFENVNRILVAKQTIEPTQIAGFNQFFDEANGSLSKTSAVGIDSKINSKTDAGILASYRDVDIPQFTGTSFLDYANRKEKLYRLYTNWLVGQNFSINLKLQQEEFTNTATGPDYLLTRSAPLTFAWFHRSGFSSELAIIYVEQEVDLGSSSTFPLTKDDFTVVNLGISYRFPQRAGAVSFYVHNLFDQEFLYHDTNFINTEPEQALYVPEQVFITKLQLNF